MKDLELFQQALGLDEHWFVSKSDFNPKEKRLDIYLDFKPGTRFECPICSTESAVHDTEEKAWRHLNFFSMKRIFMRGYHGSNVAPMV